MSQKFRGAVLILAALIGLTTTLIDGVQDEFGLLKAISLVCFAIVGLYGVRDWAGDRRG